MNKLNGRWVATVAGALGLLGAASGAVADQSSPVSEERGRMGAAERMQVQQQRTTETQQSETAVAAEVRMPAVSGIVVSVDQEARTVTLRDDEGSQITVQVPADQRLDQLKAGDHIDVNILQPLELTRPEQEP